MFKRLSCEFVQRRSLISICTRLDEPRAPLEVVVQIVCRLHLRHDCLHASNVAISVCYDDLRVRNMNWDFGIAQNEGLPTMSLSLLLRAHRSPGKLVRDETS